MAFSRIIQFPSLRTYTPTASNLSSVSSRIRNYHPPVRSLRLRTFTTSTSQGLPRKDSQDKDSMNTEATEYSKSGTDDASARQDEAAFNPNLTSPESQHEKAGEGKGVSDSGANTKDDSASNNPLEVSPANRDVSKQRPAQEGGAENSSASSATTSSRQRSSGGNSPSKGKKVA